MSREDFKEIISFLLDSGCFVFDGKFYLQTFGCIMGSPLSPILALYVMDYLLAISIPKLTFTLAFLKKYVDDLIIALPLLGIDEIIEVFNSFDQNLKFTVEREDDNNSVPFLDTRVCRVDNTIKLDWYQKGTSSGKYIHFLSDHPIGIKINFIREQKNRINRICDITFRDSSIRRLCGLLLENSYPKTMVNKLLFSTSDIPRHREEPPQDVDIGETQVVYRSLPNIHNLTNKIKDCFRDRKDLRIVSQCKKRVSDLYSRLKDPVPVSLRSSVVYEIECDSCHETYVGQTSQWLKNRITLHKSDIRTNNPRCALSTHANRLSHNIDFDNVKILDTNSNYRKRCILEMINIKTQRSQINKKNRYARFKSHLCLSVRVYKKQTILRWSS
ncbi:uncharacterized protein LOC123309637 [Coccinella septempunctata]|uniref:uncharacterized protein LOC123309637 n=1 Tax=Coccinella septempunctata TaxID=41139 RepID=UPI001D060220|nr:uncharacterized protein LOC123309637 [Coccinella septempunctata]